MSIGAVGGGVELLRGGVELSRGGVQLSRSGVQLSRGGGGRSESAKFYRLHPAFF